MLRIADRWDLRALVTEASEALAKLDAERLEELAQSCRLLNGKQEPGDGGAGETMRFRAREAVAQMAVFGRVLEATRANLDVMNRLGEMRGGRLEYSGVAGTASCAQRSAEAGDGNN